MLIHSHTNYFRRFGQSPARRDAPAEPAVNRENEDTRQRVPVR